MSFDPELSPQPQPMYIASHASNVNVHIYNCSDLPTVAPTPPLRSTVPTFSPIHNTQRTATYMQRTPYPQPPSIVDHLTQTQPRAQQHAQPQPNTHESRSRNRRQSSFFRMINLLNQHADRSSREEETTRRNRVVESSSDANNTTHSHHAQGSQSNATNTTTELNIPGGHHSGVRETAVEHETTQPPATPPVFQRLLSRTIQLPELMERIGNPRGTSPATQDYTVSFELGTLGVLDAQHPSGHVSGIQLQDLSKFTTIGLFQDIDTSYQNNTITTNDDVAQNNTETRDAVESEEEEEETCSICREQLTPQSIVRQINKCKHFFHHGCIEKWLCEHRTCPLCMQSIVDDNAENASTESTNAATQERILNLVADELGL